MSLVERKANITDLGFIYGCILYGARKGHYSFDAENPVLVKCMKKEIQSLIARQMLLDQRRGTASVFLLNNKRIATLIMSEAEPNSGSLEIYAFSVIKEFQQQGLGSQILDSVLNCYLNTDIYARCSPASESMHKLLVDRSFTLVATDADYKILKRGSINNCSMVEPLHSSTLVAGDAGI